ncbi:M20 metallopeptidase family protein [Acidaminobacter hydrogenoformans]|uniref:Hippurate hydrolase n=1 Tax=Acidaminobacter hydrogenoformans DSM 2784 TaxID=1120920 RepID=A0A1G5RTZ7_9FIRM|nr:M20 family metallopeptidase [Acidaminobacter hydrogenoformans]SCZ77595.1 hippurate hydrolase [Acidaminobacter hydrogenoformans DSM 2784]
MFMLDQATSDKSELAIRHRRALHQIPEVGFQEFKTQQYLISSLKSLEGVVVEVVAKTGVLAWIQGRSEQSVAFRADMDALEVTEKTGLPYASGHTGKMHACGHDGHMTMALLLAQSLSERRDRLEKSVLIIFQPAEEGPGGAKVLVEAGILEKYKVEAVYGYHLFPEIASGTFATRSGPIMAMTGEFDIEITGMSAHGAMPHLGSDALLAASSIVSVLQSVVSRNVKPTEAAVLTVGKMFSGEKRNVIAGQARLEGTFRAFSKEVFEQAVARMETIVRSVAEGYGCDAHVEIRPMYPPVINDTALAALFTDAVGKEFVLEIEPQMLAEDFAYYQEAVPGLFVFVGCRDAAKGHIFGLHHECFNFDESVLLNGVAAMLKVFEKSGVLL